MRRHGIVSPLAALALALACGGGSGSGDQPAEITSDDAMQIASDVLEGISLSSDLSTLAVALFAGGLFPDSADAGGDESAGFLGFAAALRAARELEPPPSLPGGVAPAAPFDPITRNCEVSGTFTVSGNVAGPDPTVGDRVEVRFENCENEGDPVLDGTLGYTITALSGNLDSVFSVSLVHTFGEFTSGTGDDREQIDGGATTTFNNTSPPLIVSSARGATLRFRSGSGDSATSLTLNGFETQLTQDTNVADDTTDDTYEIEGDGQLESSEFTGHVLYDITEALAGPEGELPNAGSVLVTGDSSAMRIVPLADGIHVDLELDLDDDGEFPPGDIIPTTWDELMML